MGLLVALTVSDTVIGILFVYASQTVLPGWYFKTFREQIFHITYITG